MLCCPTLRLRNSGLGPRCGILIVEGPDDKRLFRLHGVPSAKIVPAGGRTLLLSAHAKATPDDLAACIFLTDCDYEVALGTVAPSRGLIITRNADVESDLVALGVLEPVVIELVPAALESDDRASQIVSLVLERSQEFAQTLGQMRFVARPRGIDLGLDQRELRYGRLRGKGFSVNRGRLIDVVFNNALNRNLSRAQFIELVDAAPSGYMMCNGKDLLRAANFVLREDFRVQGVTYEQLQRLVRASADSFLEQWDVVRRIRRWENDSGCVILPPT